MINLTKAIFLDRDGVINESIVRDGKPYAPLSLAELKITTGAKEALKQLKQAGYLLIVVTNQPDVGRGKVAQAIIESINQALQQQLPLDAIEVCYHDDTANCLCRKPKPGMMLQAAKKYQIDLTQSYLIGDRAKDVEAGQAAGCKTVWLESGYREPGPKAPPSFKASSLDQAVQWILAKQE
ncbi:MAG: D,D-heptose 1,7-bisphosphate phosphatase [Gammaproteobacteria bacterium RIFCSPHIGHO2_12_FULL_35_23]|nr:MAG: D,D-heptose 1,7-bisphosphate phosphatase [Gammaproteobacteria bacterium RIFCSPHIGHO2_12_FULL_35_23]